MAWCFRVWYFVLGLVSFLIIQNVQATHKYQKRTENVGLFQALKDESSKLRDVPSEITAPTKYPSPFLPNSFSELPLRLGSSNMKNLLDDDRWKPPVTLRQRLDGLSHKPPQTTVEASLFNSVPQLIHPFQEGEVLGIPVGSVPFRLGILPTSPVDEQHDGGSSHAWGHGFPQSNGFSYYPGLKQLKPSSIKVNPSSASVSGHSTKPTFSQSRTHQLYQQMNYPMTQGDQKPNPLQRNSQTFYPPNHKNRQIYRPPLNFGKSEASHSLKTTSSRFEVSDPSSEPIARSGSHVDTHVIVNQKAPDRGIFEIIQHLSKPVEPLQSMNSGHNMNRYKASSENVHSGAQGSMLDIPDDPNFQSGNPSMFPPEHPERKNGENLRADSGPQNSGWRNKGKEKPNPVGKIQFDERKDFGDFIRDTELQSVHGVKAAPLTILKHSTNSKTIELQQSTGGSSPFGKQREIPIGDVTQPRDESQGSHSVKVQRSSAFNPDFQPSNVGNPSDFLKIKSTVAFQDSKKTRQDENIDKPSGKRAGLKLHGSADAQSVHGSRSTSLRSSSSIKKEKESDIKVHDKKIVSNPQENSPLPGVTDNKVKIDGNQGGSTRIHDSDYTVQVKKFNSVTKKKKIDKITKDEGVAMKRKLSEHDDFSQSYKSRHRDMEDSENMLARSLNFNHLLQSQEILSRIQVLNPIPDQVIEMFGKLEQRELLRKEALLNKIAEVFDEFGKLHQENSSRNSSNSEWIKWLTKQYLEYITEQNSRDFSFQSYKNEKSKQISKKMLYPGGRGEIISKQSSLKEAIISVFVNPRRSPSSKEMANLLYGMWKVEQQE